MEKFQLYWLIVRFSFWKSYYLAQFEMTHRIDAYHKYETYEQLNKEALNAYLNL